MRELGERLPPVLVVLAAGASSRLGEPKALVDLAGANPLSRLLEASSEYFGESAICVAGAHYPAILEAAPARVEVLEHPSWSEGRTGSLKAAVRARPDCDLVLAPVDVPLVPAEVFRELAREWKQAGNPARGWLAPAVSIDGELRTGHPVIIGRELAGDLEGFESSDSLRNLRKRADPLWRVKIASERILDDLDTPLDLKNFRSLLSEGR